MATSSIFTNIKLSEPDEIEKFINALDASAHDSEISVPDDIESPLTEKEMINKLMSKRFPNLCRNTQ